MSVTPARLMTSRDRALIGRRVVHLRKCPRWNSDRKRTKRSLTMRNWACARDTRGSSMTTWLSNRRPMLTTERVSGTIFVPPMIRNALLGILPASDSGFVSESIPMVSPTLSILKDATIRTSSTARVGSSAVLTVGLVENWNPASLPAMYRAFASSFSSRGLACQRASV